MLLLIDQDNVLSDFETGFRQAWTAKGHDQPALPPEQRRNFHLMDDYPAHLAAEVEAIYNTPGFFRDMPPMPGALDGIRAMREAGHEVRICTSPLMKYRHCVTEKYEWVEQHLGAEFVRLVILTRDKTLVHGDILVDDKPQVTGAHVPSWRHVLYDQPYNRHVAAPRMTWNDWQATLASLD